MALLEVCKISIPATAGGGVSTYYFQTKKNTYKGDISAQTGVEKAPDTFENDEPIIPIHQLVLSGKLMRLHAECKNGTKKRMVEILVRRDKVEEVLAQPTGSLEGKAFGTFGTIKTVRSRGMDSYK
ncbi:hypothetical protein [Chamaesiphon minutus]|uniref:Uncharacterized protein n=1 Tax=Chamaesiphon minutus (strain ATCC 27169 / PCC 6605) TaxID=1173020 RepID=K9UK99_CHAP6|nr:hypothetical protein [Chamaesiphon minutus]AFY94629.1 hypothetical protein Cha6605_3647 [Chamaesiphon minutus PCC 6605]